MEDEIRLENLNREEKKAFLNTIIEGLGDDELLDYFCVFIPENKKGTSLACPSPLQSLKIADILLLAEFW